MVNRRVAERFVHFWHGKSWCRATCAVLTGALAKLVTTGRISMTSAEEFRAEERDRMVDDIVAFARVVADAEHPLLDARVLAAMRKVPRHEFVPPRLRHAAYRNRPLPIGEGQTISQPYIVALMTDLLQLKPGGKVLEVGTGCGYQAAVLAEIGGEVYTIEIIDDLGRAAAETLQRLGYRVNTRIGDGYEGWPEAAPFDAIIVTAAPERIPPALIEQLKPGGRLVIPIGTLDQELMLITKNADGTTSNEDVVPVQFVPFTREAE